jgi:hypothetical protein
MDIFTQGFQYFGQAIFDSFLLFMVIPFSIPTFLGYHLLLIGKRKKAIWAFAVAGLIALMYIVLAGIFATLVIFLYITAFYILLVGPFKLLDIIIQWYEKKYIYDKYSEFLKKKKSETP